MSTSGLLGEISCAACIPERPQDGCGQAGKSVLTRRCVRASLFLFLWNFFLFGIDARSDDPSRLGLTWLLDMITQCRPGFVPILL